MDAVLRRVPDGGNYYLTVDLDGPWISPSRRVWLRRCAAG